MVKFVLKGKDFEEFLKTVSCKGTLQFKSQGKVEAPLFSAFFIDADKDKQLLTVLTIDTFFIQIKQLATISAKVLESGVIEITNYKRFKPVFEGLDLNKPIMITADDDSILISNEDGHEYELRIISDAGLDEVYKSKDMLYNWRKIHSLVDIDDKKIWKITVPEGTALYPMRLKTTKEQLKPLVGDSVKLTKDNSTVITSEKGVVKFHSGAPNSTNRSRHPIEYENAGKELIDFSVKFAGLQSIVPSLLDEIHLNFRKTGEDTVILRIDSTNGKINQTISIGSEDKDGVLWDVEEKIE